jgi:hypothetical protein
MTEEQAILISIILNMAVDGKCDLSQLSPNVAAFIEGTLEDYNEEDPEERQVLYWYAHEALDVVPKRKLH